MGVTMIMSDDSNGKYLLSTDGTDETDPTQSDGNMQADLLVEEYEDDQDMLGDELYGFGAFKSRRRIINQKERVIMTARDRLIPGDYTDSLALTENEVDDQNNSYECEDNSDHDVIYEFEGNRIGIALIARLELAHSSRL